MIRILKHYLPLLIVVLITGIYFYFTKPDADTITLVTIVTGYTSLLILAYSLLIGPFNIVRKKTNPVSTYFRRDISITGGVLAVIHSAAGLFVHLRGKPWLYFVKETETGFIMRFDRFGFANYTGLISALVIILLLIFSNDYFLRKMGPSRWKNLQRWSYLMFLLALAHSVLYRFPRKDNEFIWYFYVPLLLLIVAFQLAGMIMRKRNREAVQAVG